jgi:hypothetical protein
VEGQYPRESVESASSVVYPSLARGFIRTHHQQQIRDAVGKPGLKEPRFFAPVLDTFVRALPHTHRNVEANDGTVVALKISGDSGGRWLLQRENGAWYLYADGVELADAEVALDQEIAQRLFCKGIGFDEALARATLAGDRALASKALEMVSIIA